eukprot:1141281-Pelagomonas_calceolata.AAC.2
MAIHWALHQAGGMKGRETKGLCYLFTYDNLKTFLMNCYAVFHAYAFPVTAFKWKPNSIMEKGAHTSLAFATNDMKNFQARFQHPFSSAPPSRATCLRHFMNQADVLGLAKHISALAKLPPACRPQGFRSAVLVGGYSNVTLLSSFFSLARLFAAMMEKAEIPASCMMLESG